MHSQNIQNYNKIMSDKLVIKYDWSKNTMVLKEGYFIYDRFRCKWAC